VTDWIYERWVGNELGDLLNSLLNNDQAVYDSLPDYVKTFINSTFAKNSFYLNNTETLSRSANFSTERARAVISVIGNAMDEGSFMEDVATVIDKRGL
jgi:hypothetical protein